jgi:hypothetical protein
LELKSFTTFAHQSSLDDGNGEEKDEIEKGEEDEGQEIKLDALDHRDNGQPDGGDVVDAKEEEIVLEDVGEN